MNAKTAKLIRKFSFRTKRRSRWLKRVWNDTKRPVRHEMRCAILSDLQELPF